MKVRITVSSSGKAQTQGISQTLTIADAKTLDEVQQAMKLQFGDLFPKFATLDKTGEKKGKKEAKADA